MEDRIPMLMHQETIPTMRVTMVLTSNHRSKTWSVWELWDEVPPSTAQELGFVPSPDLELRETTRRPKSESREMSQASLPSLVMEVSADGEVVTWPGPEVV